MDRAKPFALVGVAGAIALVAAACGNSTTSNTSTSATVPPGLSVTSFNPSFSIMGQLKAMHNAGSGKVGVILPDTTSSTRYTAFDDPYLRKAFNAAGYSSSEYSIVNAQGSDQTELGDAQAFISQRYKVLIFDPLDSTVGSQIQAAAQQAGVKTISYDRATFTGSNVYYVSFDNVQVGKLIGQGFQKCISAWGVSNPQVFTLNGGEDTDPNAVSFAQGYNSVVWGNNTTPQPAGTTSSNGYKLVGDQITPGWVNATGGTIFQQQFTAHPSINATIEANDGLANAVISVLKQRGVGAKKVPTTGQDATQQGMINILQGYQCGSVYKPIYLEAQDTVAVATILRAGQRPPSSLVNSTTSPPQGKPGNTQPASLLTPIWVDTSNMSSTVIKDGFVQPAPLCAAVGASVCQQYNIPTS